MSAHGCASALHEQRETARERPTRGRAAQIQQSAEAYREQTVAEARGQAARFTKVYDEYKKEPAVTRQRIYLETMERVFGGTDKVILDSAQAGSGTGGSVVPILPLNEMLRRVPGTPATGGTQ